MKRIKIALLLCLLAMPGLVWAAANGVFVKDDYVFVKNGKFYMSASPTEPVVLSGISYPSAVKMVADNPSTFDRVVAPNFDFIRSCGLSVVRLQVPLKMVSKHEENATLSSQNDSVLLALAQMIEYAERIQLHVVLCLNYEVVSRSDLEQYSVDDYIALVCQNVNFKMPKTHKPLSLSPSVFSWEIGCFDRMGVFSEDVVADYARVLKFLKKAVSNQLVSISCGDVCYSRSDLLLMENLLNLPEVDYINMKLLPLEWRWTNTSSLYQTLPNVYIKAQEYFANYLRLAKRLNKPLVVSEVCYPRDRNHYEPNSPVDARNSCFNFVLNGLTLSKGGGDGVNAAFFGDFTDESEKHVPAAIYASDTQTFAALRLLAR